MAILLQYIMVGVAAGSVFALVGCGFVIIYRVTKIINFAQGTIVVVAGFATYSLLQQGMPHGVAEVAGVLVGGLVGLLIGMITLGRGNRPVMAALIITLGIAVAAYGVEIIIWGDQPVSFKGVPGAFVSGSLFLQYQYLLIIALTAAAFVALGLFFNRTLTGKAMTACSSNKHAARVVGINANRMALAAFGLAGLFGGLAGVLTTPVESVVFSHDIAIAINGFIAAIFGALVSWGRAYLGGLLLGIAESLVAGYVDGSFQLALALVILLVIMIVRAARTNSLFGEAA